MAIHEIRFKVINSSGAPLNAVSIVIPGDSGSTNTSGELTLSADDSNNPQTVTATLGGKNTWTQDISPVQPYFQPIMMTTNLVQMDLAFFGGTDTPSGALVPVGNDTEFRLMQNVTFPGVALRPNGGGVDVNLNGFTLTYDNDPRVLLPNHDFEIGTIGDTVISGWDLTLAPSADIGPNNKRLSGSQVLRFTATGPSTETVVSDDFTLPSTTEEYAVYGIFSKTINTNTQIDIRVIDTVSSGVIVTASSGPSSGQNGKMDPALFTNPSGNALRLEVDVIAPAGPLDVDLDQITVARSHHMGLSFQWSNQVAIDHIGYENLSAVAKTSFGPTHAGVRNGNIIQGSGHSVDGRPVYADLYRGTIIVDNNVIVCNGVNTRAIQIQSRNIAGNNEAYLCNNKIRHRQEIITNRFVLNPMIYLLSCNDQVDVHNNRMTGWGQAGITIGSKSGTEQTNILYNNILHQKRVANAYGISFDKENRNSLVAFNTISSPSGAGLRGILIDQNSAAQFRDVTISGNFVDVVEQTDRENTDFSARAFRWRNETSNASMQNIKVVNNTFKVAVRDGDQGEGDGATIWMEFWSGMETAGNKIQDNIFEAVNLRTDSGGKAASFSVDKHEPGIDNLYYRNTFRSNQWALDLTSPGFRDIEDMVFIDSTIEKIGPTGFTFESFRVGHGLTDNPIVRDIVMIDNIYSGGAAQIVTTGANTAQREIEFHYTTIFRVMDGVTPISGASVEVSDNNPTIVFGPSLTDAAGEVTAVIIQESWSQASGVDNRDPHEATAIFGPQNGDTSFNSDVPDQVIIINLSGAVGARVFVSNVC